MNSDRPDIARAHPYIVLLNVWSSGRNEDTLEMGFLLLMPEYIVWLPTVRILLEEGHSLRMTAEEISGIVRSELPKDIGDIVENCESEIVRGEFLAWGLSIEERASIAGTTAEYYSRQEIREVGLDDAKRTLSFRYGGNQKWFVLPKIWTVSVDTYGRKEQVAEYDMKVPVKWIECYFIDRDFPQDADFEPDPLGLYVGYPAPIAVLTPDLRKEYDIDTKVLEEAAKNETYVRRFVAVLIVLKGMGSLSSSGQFPHLPSKLASALLENIRQRAKGSIWWVIIAGMVLPALYGAAVFIRKQYGPSKTIGWILGILALISASALLWQFRELRGYYAIRRAIKKSLR